MQVCLDCGTEMPDCGERRKFCDACRKRRAREATARSEALRKEKKTCAWCGKELPPLSQTYCSDECAAAKRVLPVPKRPRKRTSELLPPDMTGWETAGKGLRVVSAEADAFGLSYGNYTAKIRAHTIEDYLRHEGWTEEEWKAVLRNCSKLKRKK